METTRAGDHFVLLETREDRVEQNQSYLSYKYRQPEERGDPMRTNRK